MYDFDLKKEVPTKVQVLMELDGKPITLGVIKEVVDKNTKNDAGVYVPSGETREQNEIDKVFNTETGLTVAEILADVDEAVFKGQWAEKNTGKTRNKAKGGAATAAPAAAGPKKVLFQK